MNTKRRAISPLITTLLLIAIAVAASVLTYSWVMSMVNTQSIQAQTQLRIDSVDWGATRPFTITTPILVQIRNTGSVSAQIETVAIKENKAGTAFTVLTADASNPKSLDIGLAQPFKFTGYAVSLSSSYIIRVTATTGFYYEMVVTTPS